ASLVLVKLEPPICQDVNLYSIKPRVLADVQLPIVDSNVPSAAADRYVARSMDSSSMVMPISLKAACMTSPARRLVSSEQIQLKEIVAGSRPEASKYSLASSTLYSSIFLSEHPG